MANQRNYRFDLTLHYPNTLNMDSTGYEAAVQAFEQARACAELITSGNNNQAITRTCKVVAELQSLARTHLRFNNNTAPAVQVATQALDMLLSNEQLQVSIETAKCHVLLATIHEKTGNDARALEHCEAAVTIFRFNEGEFPRSLALGRLYEQMVGIQARLVDHHDHDKNGTTSHQRSMRATSWHSKYIVVRDLRMITDWWRLCWSDYHQMQTMILSSSGYSLANTKPGVPSKEVSREYG